MINPFVGEILVIGSHASLASQIFLKLKAFLGN